MMMNVDHEGQTFLSHPHIYNGLFFRVHHSIPRPIGSNYRLGGGGGGTHKFFGGHTYFFLGGGGNLCKL